MTRFREILIMSLTEKLASAMKSLPHQDRLVEKLKDDRAGLLVYHGLGSGKTFAAINAAKQLDLPILAITPASLRENFKKEINKSGYDGESKVVSYEEAVKNKDNPEFLEYAKNSLVVYDEAHRMGQEGTARSKLTSQIPANKTMLLTGTPIRNRPQELIPLLKALNVKNLPTSSKDFSDAFIGHDMKAPSLWNQLVWGDQIEDTVSAKNLNVLKGKLQGYIDYHGSDKSEMPEVKEETIKVKMSPLQYDTYKYMIGKSPALAHKIRYGIPPDKKDASKMQSFMIGPRLVGNNPAIYNQAASAEDASKVMRAADEIEKRYKSDENFRGVAYSAFLESGVDALAKELEKRDIPYNTFTGTMNDQQKKKAVEEYNTGKNPVLLLSGAGSEGLDLKGTKLMQVLEPHWNNEQLNQVKGRAIRYKSHSHLPEDERTVEVQNFQSVLPDKTWSTVKNFIKMKLGLSTKKEYSADEYLDMMAEDKQKLNDQFLSALMEVGAA